MMLSEYLVGDKGWRNAIIVVGGYNY